VSTNNTETEIIHRKKIALAVCHSAKTRGFNKTYIDRSCAQAGQWLQDDDWEDGLDGISLRIQSSAIRLMAKIQCRGQEVAVDSRAKLS
jgi:hypothetical protein